MKCQMMKKIKKQPLKFRFRSWLPICAFFLLLFSPGALPALAQSKTKNETAKPTTNIPAYNIQGFRSARFGMTEREIRKAIAKDHKKSDQDIELVKDEINGTTALTLITDDLLPNTGTAILSYIMGYKSKKMMQVNIAWGAVREEKIESERIVNIANQLRAYFSERKFKKESVIVNRQLENGSVLVFRGSDDKGRTILMQLIPTGNTAAENTAEQDKDKAEKKQDDNLRLTLILSYLSDPNNPDIYQIEKGLF